jgi:hypothetical protein
MAKPNIFPPEHLKFIRHLYMRVMLMPAEITDKVNAKYGSNYSVSQLSRAINNRGWSARRKNMVERLGPIEAKKDTAIQRELVRAHDRVMDDVVKGTTEGLQRAMQFVAQADNPRTMQAAAAAAKSLFTTFRLAAGLDNSSNRPAGANVYQFNFASTKVDDVVEAAQPVDVDTGDDDAAPA